MKKCILNLVNTYFIVCPDPVNLGPDSVRARKQDPDTGPCPKTGSGSSPCLDADPGYFGCDLCSASKIAC